MIPRATRKQYALEISSDTIYICCWICSLVVFCCYIKCTSIKIVRYIRFVSRVIHNSKYWHWSYRFVEVRRYKRTELKGLHEEARGNVTTHKGETIVRDYSTINKEEQNWTFLIDMSSKNGANAIKTSLPPSSTSTQMHVLPFPKSACASKFPE